MRELIETIDCKNVRANFKLSECTGEDSDVGMLL